MTAWKVFAPEHTRNGGTRQKVETHVLTKPDLNLQPVLHHHSNNIMNPKKNKSAKRDIILSLSTSNADKEGNESLQAISLEIDSENIESTIDDKNKKNLSQFFNSCTSSLCLHQKKSSTASILNHFLVQMRMSDFFKLLVLIRPVFFSVSMPYQLARSHHQNLKLLSLNQLKRKRNSHRYLQQQK